MGDGMMVAEVHFRTPGGKKDYVPFSPLIEGETYMQAPPPSTLGGGVMMFSGCNYLRPGAVLASSKPCLLLTRIDYW